MRVARKIDNNGFYIEDVETNLTENTDEIIITDIITGYVKPKWNGVEWIEGATEEEITEWQEQQNESPIPPLDEIILGCVLEMSEIIYA